MSHVQSHQKGVTWGIRSFRELSGWMGCTPGNVGKTGEWSTKRAATETSRRWRCMIATSQLRRAIHDEVSWRGIVAMSWLWRETVASPARSAELNVKGTADLGETIHKVVALSLLIRSTSWDWLSRQKESGGCHRQAFVFGAMSFATCLAPFFHLSALFLCYGFCSRMILLPWPCLWDMCLNLDFLGETCSLLHSPLGPWKPKLLESLLVWWYQLSFSILHSSLTTL